MKFSTRSIVILAILSIVLAAASIYLNEYGEIEQQKNATVQFQVGVTIRPRAAPEKSFYERFLDLFRSPARSSEASRP